MKNLDSDRSGGIASLPDSPIRVCFTGRNRAGSWAMRGDQIAACRRNWSAEQQLTDEDHSRFDLYCFVKRPIPAVQERLLATGKLVVFDVVDSWAQPDDNSSVRNTQEARALFASKWKDLPPFHAHIFANRRMHSDLMPLSPFGTYIYHHYNPLLPRNPVRREVRTIGYEGNANYLGEWREVIERLCQTMGLRFVVNPSDFSEIDIGFATRGGVHTGFLPNSYKSNVKLANFYATGTPCLVGANEVSYQETDCGFVRYFATERQLGQQLTQLLDYETRLSIHQAFLAAAPGFAIERMTAIYEHFFGQVIRLTSGRRRAMMRRNRLVGANKKGKQARAVRKPERPRFVPPPEDGKKRINLGSGDKNLPGYINVDVATSRKGTSPNVLSDVRKLAFEDSYADEILAVHLVEHFYRWEVGALLQEWGRVLKPGGKLVLECPNILYAAKQIVEDEGRLDSLEGWRTTMFVLYGDPSWQDPLMCHRWGWTPRILSRLLTELGFQDVHEEPALFKRGNPRDMRIVATKKR